MFLTFRRQCRRCSQFYRISSTHHVGVNGCGHVLVCEWMCVLVHQCAWVCICEHAVDLISKCGTKAQGNTRDSVCVCGCVCMRHNEYWMWVCLGWWDVCMRECIIRILNEFHNAHGKYMCVALAINHLLNYFQLRLKYWNFHFQLYLPHSRHDMPFTKCEQWMLFIEEGQKKDGRLLWILDTSILWKKGVLNFSQGQKLNFIFCFETIILPG